MFRFTTICWKNLWQDSASARLCVRFHGAEKAPVPFTAWQPTPLESATEKAQSREPAPNTLRRKRPSIFFENAPFPASNQLTLSRKQENRLGLFLPAVGVRVKLLSYPPALVIVPEHQFLSGACWTVTVPNHLHQLVFSVPALGNAPRSTFNVHVRGVG